MPLSNSTEYMDLFTIAGLLIGNSLDYLKLFLPLLIFYKVYIKFHSKFKKVLSGTIFLRIFDFFAFGSGTSEILLTTAPSANFQEESNMYSSTNIINFVICFLGLQASFLSWGVMQERIIKYDYRPINSENHSASDGEHRDKFKNIQFLVLSNRIAGLVISSVIMIIFQRETFRYLKHLQKIVGVKHWAPLFICSYSSLSNVLSSCFQYEALKYVSFTTQLLAKSSKSVFVMITGRVIMKKQYKTSEYISVVMICLGIFLFSDVTNVKSAQKLIGTTFPGLVCLFGYLISDSFTSTWQDNLIKTFSMSSMAMMFMTNFYSCLYTFSSLVYQSEFFETIEFIRTHAEIMDHILLLSMASAIGQIFIFITIQKFGALVFTLIMTTRQLLAIMFSAIIFEHSLSLQSIFGICLIFSTLFFKQFLNYMSKTKK